MRALMFGFLVLAMVAVGCSGDDDDAATPTTTASATTVASSVTEAATTTTTTSVQEMEVSTTTAPPAEVIEGAFTFADDDLCEWVSAEKVAEFAAAEYEWDGTAVLEEAGPDSCQWILTSTAGDDAGSVWAGNATSTSDNDFSKRHIADFDAEVGSGYVREGGSAMSGHPSLSDGVVVYRLGSWFDEYAFWVPPSGEALLMRVPLISSDGGDWADREARFFGVADRFVQELGWLG